MKTLFSRLASLFGQGDGATPAPPIDANTDLASLPKTINVQAAAALKARKDVLLIDVREDWEYAQGHIPNVKHIPLGELSSRLAEIPKNKAVILTCRSGSRSAKAFSMLRQNGYDNTHNMAGGFMAWQKSGYPTK